MKLLHSADWHLDSPFVGRTPEQAEYLRQALLNVPQKVAAAAQGCQLMVLSGDLFDGAYSRQSLQALQNALEEVQIPVVIAPGNHDFYSTRSPWQQERFPGNVHIFTSGSMESIAFPELDCRVYGAAFSSMDSAALLEGFRAEQAERFSVGVLHGDPLQTDSPYDPITTAQVAQSGLCYLALGHIHKQGSFLAGDTLCAWSGCPMGRGFDELEEKGVLQVTLGDRVETRFIPLDTPRFYDWALPAAAPLDSLLPPVGNQHFYRITLTGESEGADLAALSRQYSQFPNLLLRDRTVPPVDVWAGVGADTLEGVYFGLLQQAMEGQDEETRDQIRLAAKISRKLLLGQEVVLP